MPNYARMVVLDVGQGSGNFLEVYEDRGDPPREELVAAFLVDFGTDRYHREAGIPAIDYIVGRLTSMPGGAVLDTLLLTHGDSDHVNLLYDLLRRFRPLHAAEAGDTRPQLTINRVKYCGAPGTYAKVKVLDLAGVGEEPEPSVARSILTRLRFYLPGDDEPTEFGNDDSSVDGFLAGTPRPAPFHEAAGVRMYSLMANVTDALAHNPRKRRPDAGYRINTKSLVVLLDYQGVQFVVTGDATGITLAECNRVITEDVRAEFLPNVFMVTLPHHGALNTGFKLLDAGRSVEEALEDGRENMRDFAGKVRAKTVTASAEETRNNHPSIQVVDCFMPPLEPVAYYADDRAGAGRHFFTAYYNYQYGYTLADPPGARWPYWGVNGEYSLQTAANVYTTLNYVAGFALPLVYPSPRIAGTECPPLEDGAALPAAPDLPGMGVRWVFTVRGPADLAVTAETNRAHTIPRGRSLTALPAEAPVPAVPVRAVAAAPAGRAGLPGLRVVP